MTPEQRMLFWDWLIAELRGRLADVWYEESPDGAKDLALLNVVQYRDFAQVLPWLAVCRLPGFG
jgi:hypothetical protein